MSNHITHPGDAPCASPGTPIVTTSPLSAAPGLPLLEDLPPFARLYAMHLSIMHQRYEDAREQHGSHLDIYRRSQKPEENG
jgi:hypothetical protein